MRRKDREITDGKMIDDIINSCTCCRIGFNDNSRVYIMPLSFGFAVEEGKRIFYFHSASEGRKVDLVKTSPCVGFEMDTDYQIRGGEKACDFTAGYKSVICTGMIRLVEDSSQKLNALNCLMSHYDNRNGWKFDQKMLDSVCVFKLIVEEISCKEHK